MSEAPPTSGAARGLHAALLVGLGAVVGIGVAVALRGDASAPPPPRLVATSAAVAVTTAAPSSTASADPLARAAGGDLDALKAPSFRKFGELGSARQVVLWLLSAKLTFPTLRRTGPRRGIEWGEPTYGSVLRILQNPVYAGAYVFGRSEGRTRIADGRAVKTSGHRRPRDRWSVLLKDHHQGYISWEQFEKNQVEISENAHRMMKPDRKAGRGGRALLAGMVRCGCCGRMLRLTYATRARRPHRYQCAGGPGNLGRKACVSAGGVRVDEAVAAQLIETLTPHAIDAALEAARRTKKNRGDACAAVERELDEARYEAALEARRHRAVDPDKRHVARELEARWEAALERACPCGKRA